MQTLRKHNYKKSGPIDKSFNVRCLCPGEWEVSKGKLTVSISRYDHLDYDYGQWVARATWIYGIYTDPLIYLKEAKENAVMMIRDAISEGYDKT